MVSGGNWYFLTIKVISQNSVYNGTKLVTIQDDQKILQFLKKAVITTVSDCLLEFS